MMRLSPELVGQLVADEEDRRELRSLRCDSIPVQLTRSVIAEVLERDPDLTIGEIAHWLDMRQVDFERAFLGKTKEGRLKRRVNVSSASRLMIALGRARTSCLGAEDEFLTEDQQVVARRRVCPHSKGIPRSRRPA